MAELFRASEHEPLAGEEWSWERAEQAIATIVADAEAAFDGTRWPWHPSDGEEEWGLSDVYIGGAGMIWALDELGSTGWGDAAVSFVDHYRARPSPWDEDPVETSYHFGELGIALVAFRLTGETGIADRIHELVLSGDSDANEVMYGTPGSLLVAEAMLAWTGEPRWDEAWNACAERVLAARDPDRFWMAHVGGFRGRFLGPAHGYAGNIRAFANRGRTLEPADLSPYLLREDGLANWMPTTEITPEQIRVQWCHGAPGMVATLGELLDEELALAGGELTWRAGPLAKGPGLCHGIAGNAYAFLVLHRRTGDEVWLDRARAFAMHVIGQVERERAAVGRGRYSLFTGDIGVALFLRDLLAGDDRFPTMGPFA